MKNTVILFIFILSQLCGYSQKVENILKDFKSARNDSDFISNNSIYPYEVITIDKSLKYDSTNLVTKQILSANIGDVLGPFESDSVLEYIKIVNRENAHKIRVGNIWIDIKRGYENAKMLANQIVVDVNNGKSYNTFCYLYSDDRNKEKDCDLGWFFNIIMVEPFASEIIKHKLGDVFVVETKFGFHVVKILGDPYLELMKVDYVKLTLKK